MDPVSHKWPTKLFQCTPESPALMPPSVEELELQMLLAEIDQAYRDLVDAETRARYCYRDPRRYWFVIRYQICERDVNYHRERYWVLYNRLRALLTEVRSYRVPNRSSM